MQGTPAFLAKVYVFWNFRSTFRAKWHKTSLCFSHLFLPVQASGNLGLGGFLCRCWHKFYLFKLSSPNISLNLIPNELKVRLLCFHRKYYYLGWDRDYCYHLYHIQTILIYQMYSNIGHRYSLLSVQIYLTIHLY